MSRRALTLFVFLLAGIASAASQERSGGILQGYPLSADNSQQWKLPDKLNEISGLAVTEDARLLAVTDEVAIVYELDYSGGRLVKAFALGDPVIRGDFEGIAYFDGRVWLVTSDAVIYAFEEGQDGERVAFDRHDTGLGRFCEFEGLVYRRQDEALLLPCKGVKRGSGLGGLAIFAWSTASNEVLEEKRMALPDRDIAAAIRSGRFSPSGIAIAEQSGNLLIVAARERSIIELDAAGNFLSAKVLPPASHRQAEGIGILPTGELLIADEGGAHKARLAMYRPARCDACNR
ncbi:MAG: SdiA-regulated domain-containing protein [Woeseia sp.]